MERHVFMKVLLPSVLVLGHFFILSMRGQVPTKEAALKKKAEEYEALMASRMTSMEMTQTSSKLIIFAILDFFHFLFVYYFVTM